MRSYVSVSALLCAFMVCDGEASTPAPATRGNFIPLHAAAVDKANDGPGHESPRFFPLPARGSRVTHGIAVQVKASAVPEAMQAKAGSADMSEDDAKLLLSIFSGGD